MKHIFEEYSDAIVQVSVLFVLTLMLSAIAFAGVRGILNVTGKVAEVEETTSTDYTEKTQLENYASIEPPTFEYNNNVKKGEAQTYDELFSHNSGQIVIKGVFDEMGNDITSQIDNPTNKTLTFNNEGFYIVKATIYGDKQITKEFNLAV